MAVYTTIDNPELYFQTKIYTGDGNDDRDIVFDVTDTSLQPNMLWSARRDSGDNISIYDSVRGDGKELRSSSSSVELDRSDNIQALNSNGFQVGTDGQVNASGGTYVSWAWKESATAGFDIVGYTGNKTDDVDISHSLSAVPHVIIVKNRENVNNEHWGVYHHKNTSAPETDYLYLSSTAATTDHNEFWSDEAPTSSVFTIGRQDVVNGSSEDHIAYLWTAKQGYSKFGSYVGNGASDTNGQFIFLGFRPAMVLVKRTNGTKDWKIFDNKRNGYNGSNEVLEPNNSDAEDTTEFLDFLSNGFRWIIPSSDAKYADVNGDGDTFIYMAFAEAPLVNSKGVPCNAR